MKEMESIKQIGHCGGEVWDDPKAIYPVTTES